MSVYSALLSVHIVICFAVIGIVLLQHGKGADAGAAFGSGASGTVFGSRGSASFLSKVTTLLTAGFFITSLVLAMLSGSYSNYGGGTGGTSVMQEQSPATSQGKQSAPERAPAPPASGETPTQDNGPAAPAPAPSE